jgi:hypothetical protein
MLAAQQVADTTIMSAMAVMAAVMVQLVAKVLDLVIAVEVVMGTVAQVAQL